MSHRRPPAGSDGQSRFRRPSAGTVFLALFLGVLLPSGVARAIPASGIAIPPPTRVDRFNPDQQVCTSEAIRKGFAAQMLPWADQPEAVVARLREVQLDMTRATLRRCVGKGLMDRTQAEQLFDQLMASPPSPASPSPVPSSASPAPSTAPAPAR